VREVLNRVGDKWSVLVVGLLGDGPKRFGELRRSIEGISQRMLTLALRNLECGGLVARRHHATFPPRVDYEVTGPGRELSERLRVLLAWMQANGVVLPANQEQPHDRARTRRGT